MRFAILSLAFSILGLFSLPALAAVPDRLFYCYVVSTSEYGSFHSDPSWMTVRDRGSHSVELRIDFEDQSAPVDFTGYLESDLTPARMERYTISDGSRTLTLIQDETGSDGSVAADYQFEHEGAVARGQVSCTVWPGMNRVAESAR